MYKPAWKQEYIISGDFSLLRLFAESEDTLDEFLHRIIVLLWIDNRSVLARTGILSSLLLLILRNCALSLLLSATLLLLGYASASAIAAWTNIVLIARALVAVRLLIALLVAVLVVALLIVVAALVVIAILLLAVALLVVSLFCVSLLAVFLFIVLELSILLCTILSIVLRSLFLTLVWLVWLALV